MSPRRKHTSRAARHSTTKPRGSASRVGALGTDFWQSASPADIRAALLQHVPDLICANALRDRAAANTLSDPTLSWNLASALIKAVQLHGHRLSDEIVAIAWRCRAEASLFTGRWREAREAYERACEAAERGGHRGLLGQMMVGRIHVLSATGEFDEAERLYRQAERILEREQDLIYLGKLHMNRGNAHYHRDGFAEAHESYAKAAAVFEKAGIRDATWASLTMNQANACTNLSRVTEARALFLQTEAESERLGLDSMRAISLLNRAVLEGLRGEYRTALNLLEQAEAAFEHQGSRDLVASAQHSRAEIYLELGMAAEAAELTHTAAQLFMAEDMATDAVLARLDHARSLLHREQPREAAALLNEVYGFFQKHRMRPRRAFTLLQMARAALQLGRSGEAAATAERAQRQYERLGFLRGTSEARRIRAAALLAGHRLAAAEKVLRPSELARSAISLGERFETWRLAGGISLARGRSREAGQRLARAARLLEDQRQLIPGAELRARAFAHQVQVYHDLIALELRRPRPRFDRLFEHIDHARARLFRERLGRGHTQRADRVIELRARLGSLTGRLEQIELRGEETPAREQVVALRREIREVEKQISAEFHRTAAAEISVAGRVGRSSPDRVLKALAPGTLLLQFFISDDRVLALVLGRRRRALHVLPSSDTALRQAMEGVRFQMGAAALAARRGGRNMTIQRQAAEAALRKLYQKLMDPIAGELKGIERLLILPHDWLHEVPFECLHDGEHYLGERHAIVRCPHADFPGLLAERERCTSRRVTLCGMIDSGPAFAGGEIAAVARHFSRGNLRVLKNPSSGDLLGALPSSRVVHVATHGAFRADNPLFSRLSTTDGAVFLADILDVELTADLVVLSACESGQLHDGPADDLSSVAHGFLAAGARSLLATRWRIHDEATGQLIDSFYRHYTAKKSNTRLDVARSLAAAQSDLREQWDHPFYWAGFSVFGS